MISDVLLYTLLSIGGVWLGLLLYGVWPYDRAVSGQRLAMPATPQRKRSQEPQPFAGLTPSRIVPPVSRVRAPQALPSGTTRTDALCPTDARVRSTPRMHFCPHANCAYRGWVGLGNLRANGHPSGGPWRQLHCTACEGYFLETHGTLLHGKRVVGRAASCV